MKNKETLLQKAKNIKNKHWEEIKEEDIELVFAHLVGKITIPKIQKVKSFPKGNSIYSYMIRAIREGVKRGKICWTTQGMQTKATSITEKSY